MYKKLFSIALLTMLLACSCTVKPAQDGLASGQAPAVLTDGNTAAADGLLTAAPTPDPINFALLDELVDQTPVIFIAKVASAAAQATRIIDGETVTVPTYFELQPLEVFKKSKYDTRFFTSQVYIDGDREKGLMKVGETRLFFLWASDIGDYYMFYSPVGCPLAENGVLTDIREGLFPNLTIAAKGHIFSDGVSLAEVKSKIAEAVSNGRNAIPTPKDPVGEILSSPTPELSEIPRIAAGAGCYTAYGREAVNTLLSSADCRMEIMLPHDSCVIEEAIFRYSGMFMFRCIDSITGNTLLYDSQMNNRDFYPWEMGWKKASLNGQVYYKDTLKADVTGAPVTFLYWEAKGWTTLLQVSGTAGSEDIKRYLSMTEKVYNEEKPSYETDKPLIGSKETLKRLLADNPDLSFEQHKNNIYPIYISTKNLHNFEEFIYTRLGMDGYYTYRDGENELAGISIKDDGGTIRMAYGELYFTYETKYCPDFPDRIFPDDISLQTKKAGTLDVDGTTYYYDVEKNYKKFNTRIFWFDGGVRLSISFSGDTWQTPYPGMIQKLVSPVRYVEIKE
ncbi:MAG: hypothetical protein ACYCX2_04730 [Christensenellales bacterium]